MLGSQNPKQVSVAQRAAILTQLYKSSPSQADWSSNCELRKKMKGREKEIFTYSNINKDEAKRLSFKHQNYCFGSRGPVPWASGVWKGGCGAEETVPLSSLKVLCPLFLSWRDPSCCVGADVGADRQELCSYCCLTPAGSCVLHKHYLNSPIPHSQTLLADSNKMK